MNPLELRKIILREMVYDAPEGAPLLDAQGYPVKPGNYPVRITTVFWVPQAKPFRRTAGETIVLDPRPFEVQALADGAISEFVVDVYAPRVPEQHELPGLLMPIWEKLTVAALGYLPNKPPQDDDPKFAIRFEAV